MPDMEKVVKGLEFIRKRCTDANPHLCRDCYYFQREVNGLKGCVVHTAAVDDALALLRELQRDISDMREDLQSTLAENLRLAELVALQEPRVMTPEDWENNPNVDETGMLPVWMEWSPERKRDITFNCTDGWEVFTLAELEIYRKKGARAWTSRPTDAQREEGEVGMSITKEVIAKCDKCGKRLEFGNFCKVTHRNSLAGKLSILLPNWHSPMEYDLC